MTRALWLVLVLAVGCTSDHAGKHEYTLSGDQCAVYVDAQTCDANAPCTWIDLGRPCQPGMTCVSGVCYDPNGSGSGSGGGGSGGSGSGGAACACFNGGACFEQIGGPAQQAGGGPQIQCGPPYACPGGNLPCDPCASITGQGTCSLDPSVANLCLCDNGIR